MLNYFQFERIYLCQMNAGFCSCGAFIHVGLLFMWGFCSCGAFIHVGLLFMWGFYSCGAFVHVRLLFMWGFYSCGAFVRVGILAKWVLIPHSSLPIIVRSQEDQKMKTIKQCGGPTQAIR